MTGTSCLIEQVFLYKSFVGLTVKRWHMGMNDQAAAKVDHPEFSHIAQHEEIQRRFDLYHPVIAGQAL